MIGPGLVDRRRLHPLDGTKYRATAAWPLSVSALRPSVRAPTRPRRIRCSARRERAARPVWSPRRLALGRSPLRSQHSSARSVDLGDVPHERRVFDAVPVLDLPGYDRVGVRGQQRRRWATAGILASVATLARPNGLVTAIVLGFVAYRAGHAPRRYRRTALVTLPSVGMLVAWMRSHAWQFRCSPQRPPSRPTASYPEPFDINASTDACSRHTVTASKQPSHPPRSRPGGAFERWPC